MRNIRLLYNTGEERMAPILIRDKTPLVNLYLQSIAFEALSPTMLSDRYRTFYTSIFISNTSRTSSEHYPCISYDIYCLTHHSDIGIYLQIKCRLIVVSYAIR
jgi:hypothetical protein